MKGFEAAYRVLDGIKFADPASRENALWLALWLTQVVNRASSPTTAKRPPGVAIEGPWKVAARLVDQVAGAAGLLGPRDPICAKLRARILNDYAESSWPLLWLEDYRHDEESDSLLQAWLTSQVWEERRSGSTEMLRYDLRTVTVLTSREFDLPSDLKRRVIFIRVEGKANQ